MKRTLLACLVVLAFSTTAMAIDIAISTQAAWWGQAAADREMQEIVDNVSGATVEQFTASDQTALADWVVAHTDNGAQDLLILCGQFPDTIYAPGNSQADDSLAELFLDAGNTIINTADYMFYVVNGSGTNGVGGLQTMMDIAGITMWDDNTPCVVTAEGQAITPSLQDVSSDRPFHLDQLAGDWIAELILAQNAAGTRADPVIVKNTATGGRIGVFFQVNAEDNLPRGEVISEWINNWYLLNVADPANAGDPTPNDQATDVLRDVELSWSPGENAGAHKVYFSASWDDVNDRATGALVGDGISETSVDVGRLEFDSTYYWVVDEMNALNPANVSMGSIWSFTVEPETLVVGNVSAVASSEFDENSTADDLVNGSGMNGDLHNAAGESMWLSAQGGLPATVEFTFDRAEMLDTMMIWNQNQLVEMILGFGAKDVVIETSPDGVNFTAMDPMVLNQAMGTDGLAATDIIDMGGVLAKVVRITINTAYGFMPQVGLSEVRFNALPVYPRNIAPDEGASTDGLAADMSWRSGRQAAQSKILLSKDKAAVEDGSAVVATLDVPVREDMRYTATGLDYLSLYYWQIIDVNGGLETAGPIQTLYTPAEGVIDDMEFYKDEEFKEIWSFWADGYNDATNGSTVGNGSAPETVEVYEGSQSMPMEYDNSSASKSEATRTFDPPLDLTAGNPDNIGVYFKGIPYGFNAWFSLDGPDFFSPSGLNPVTSIVMSDDALIGLALTSHDTANPHTAIFSEIKTSGGVGGDWTVEALGDDTSGHPANIGSVSGDTATLNAAGNDIWGNQDAFVYAYKQLTGDGVIEAKVETLEGDNGTQHDWAKVGVMIRDSNARNSTQAFMAVTGANGIRFQRRENTGGASSNDDGSFTDGGPQAMGQEPAWVKIERMAMNTGAQVYLIVTDSTNKSVKVPHPDPEATRLGAWTLLSVPMGELSGINAASVKSITVGVEGAGAVGKIFVDYLRVAREAYVTYDLFAHYALEGDVMDDSGNGFHGTITGEPVFVDGAVGQGLEFSAAGRDDYVTIGTMNPSFSSGAISVGLWAKWNGLSDQWQGLIGKRDTWAAASMMWHIEANLNNGSVGIGREGGPGVSIQPGGGEDPNLPIGEWTHVAFTADGATGVMYENGVRTNSGPFTFGSGTGASMQFGAGELNGGNSFNGALDEIYIYDRVLSDDEMAALATP